MSFSGSFTIATNGGKSSCADAVSNHTIELKKHNSPYFELLEKTFNINNDLNFLSNFRQNIKMYNNQHQEQLDLFSNPKSRNDIRESLAELNLKEMSDVKEKDLYLFQKLRLFLTTYINIVSSLNGDEKKIFQTIDLAQINKLIVDIYFVIQNVEADINSKYNLFNPLVLANSNGRVLELNRVLKELPFELLDTIDENQNIFSEQIIQKFVDINSLHSEILKNKKLKDDNLKQFNLLIENGLNLIKEKFTFPIPGYFSIPSIIEFNEFNPAWKPISISELSNGGFYFFISEKWGINVVVPGHILVKSIQKNIEYNGTVNKNKITYTVNPIDVVSFDIIESNGNIHNEYFIPGLSKKDKEMPYVVLSTFREKALNYETTLKNNSKVSFKAHINQDGKWLISKKLTGRIIKNDPDSDFLDVQEVDSPFRSFSIPKFQAENFWIEVNEPWYSFGINR